MVAGRGQTRPIPLKMAHTGIGATMTDTQCAACGSEAPLKYWHGYKLCPKCHYEACKAPSEVDVSKAEFKAWGSPRNA